MWILDCLPWNSFCFLEVLYGQHKEGVFVGLVVGFLAKSPLTKLRKQVNRGNGNAKNKVKNMKTPTTPPFLPSEMATEPKSLSRSQVCLGLHHQLPWSRGSTSTSEEK